MQQLNQEKTFRQEVKIFSPGKLFLAGEYGVVQAGNPAILVPVNRGITVTAVPIPGATGYTEVASELLGTEIKVDFSAKFSLGSPAEYAHNALQVASAYAAQKLVVTAQTLSALKLEIRSDLQAADGTKFGFGSSGAVVVSVIKALLDTWRISVTNLELFKLSMLAVLQTERRASGADVALAVMQQPILYRSFDRATVLQQLDAQGLEAVIGLVEQPWDKLEISRQEITENLAVLPVFTGKAAKTKDQVTRLDQAIVAGQVDFGAFAHENAAAVNELSKALETGDTDLTVNLLNKINQQLLELDSAPSKGLGIFTPELEQIIDLVKENDAAAKISGAGGGDCAISVSNKAKVDELKAKLAAAGYAIPAQIITGKTSTENIITWQKTSSQAEAKEYSTND